MSSLAQHNEKNIHQSVTQANNYVEISGKQKKDFFPCDFNHCLIGISFSNLFLSPFLTLKVVSYLKIFSNYSNILELQLYTQTIQAHFCIYVYFE